MNTDRIVSRPDPTWAASFRICVPGPIFSPKHPERAIHIHICFQFDISTIRMFCRPGHRFLRPIFAAISILLQAQALNVSESAPMGAPIVTPPSSTYITSTDGIRIMCQACLLA
jgi:hypothetical protein